MSVAECSLAIIDSVMERKGCLLVCFYVCLFVGCEVNGQVAELCRPKERFLSCGGCQKTCDEPAPVCVGICKTGCYCPEDEVRNATGHCVKLADCPPVFAANLHSSEPRATDLKCPENEEYKLCEVCNRTCDNPDPICPAQCARGCFCKGDLVRDKDGKCVSRGECSNVKKNEIANFIRPMPYQLTCGPHQIYQDCQICERTCSSSEPVCQYPCSAGCFCKDGYLKAPSGQCVKLEYCPRAEVSVGGAEPSVEDCASDEVYLSCGWCEPSCWEPRPQCPLGVCTRGCLCRPPLLRHHSGHCVEEKACSPQKCLEPNEEFVCRYGCEARCDQVCTSRLRRCVLGCHCRLGLLRDSDGRCVTVDRCSPSHNTTNITRSSIFKEINIKPKNFISNDIPSPIDPRSDSQTPKPYKGIVSAVNFYKDFFGTNIVPGTNYRSIDLINRDSIPTYNNEKHIPQTANHRDIRDESLSAAGLGHMTSFSRSFKEENAAKTHEDVEVKEVHDAKGYMDDILRVMKDLVPLGQFPMNFTIVKYPLWT